MTHFRAVAEAYGRQETLGSWLSRKDAVRSIVQARTSGAWDIDGAGLSLLDGQRLVRAWEFRHGRWRRADPEGV